MKGGWIDSEVTSFIITFINRSLSFVFLTNIESSVVERVDNCIQWIKLAMKLEIS